VTQIFFDLVEADGRKWAAVIDHSRGGRTFHSLRGNGAARKPAKRRRRMLNADTAEAARNAIPSDGPAMSAGEAARR
jgi:hypothetical protein